MLIFVESKQPELLIFLMKIETYGISVLTNFKCMNMFENIPRRSNQTRSKHSTSVVAEGGMGRNKLKLNYFFIFRPFPFRVENQNTGEALSLWHLTSSAPSLPFHVEKTETGPELKASYPPKTGNYQRSFVLRRHAHTGPLCPLNFVPAAIASAVCLLMHF